MSAATQCPRCGVAVRPGATKCRSCRRWIGGRPGRPLNLSTLFAFTFGLVVAGAGLGITVMRARSAPTSPLDRLVGAPSAPASAAAPASAGASASAAAPAPASAAASAAAPASAADASWSEPRIVRLSASPVDVALTDDGATALALGADGVLRVVDAVAGREDRRIALPGQPRRIRALGSRYVAALDAKGVLPVVDLKTGAVARLDAGGPVSDVIALGEGKVLLAASVEAGRVTRFVAHEEAGASPGWRTSGAIAVSRPLDLGITSGERELLAVLARGPAPGAPGAVELLDPRVEPFGASRLLFPVALDAGAALIPGPARAAAPASASAGAPGAARESVAVLDRGGAQMLRITPGALEILPLGAAPKGGALGAFRLGDRHLVVLDRAGAALVHAAPDREGAADPAPATALPLGAPPAGAALTPDGRALLVPLGEETAVLSGDPPAVAARLRTGAGSRAVAVAASGRRAAVAATQARSLAILDRR